MFARIVSRRMDFDSKSKNSVKLSQRSNHSHKLSSLNISFSSFCFFNSLLLVTIFNKSIICMPQQETIARGSNIQSDDLVDKNSLSSNYVVTKLNSHISKVEYDLEQYLGIHYLPYLQFFATTINRKDYEMDSETPKDLKALLRLTTIHAYLTIHQSALLSSAIRALIDYFNYLEEKFLKENSNEGEIELKISSAELGRIFVYLNYQIRSSVYEDKFDYLNEFAILNSRYESPVGKSEESLSRLEKFIKFIKVKTNFSRSRLHESKLEFDKLEQRDKKSSNFAELEEKLNFSLNRPKIQQYADDFYKKHGLTPIISGYLLMSADDEFLNYNKKGRYSVRRFNFKKYFDDCKTGNEEEDLSKLKIHSFDPVFPLNIEDIPHYRSTKYWKRLILDRANEKIKQIFHQELTSTTILLQESEKEVLTHILMHFNDGKLVKALNEHDKDDEKCKSSRKDLLLGMGEIIAEYHILKVNALDRFIRLAKTHIGYDDNDCNHEVLKKASYTRMSHFNMTHPVSEGADCDEGNNDDRCSICKKSKLTTSKSLFVVPFNNEFVALRIQQLLLSFYQVMTLQASFTTSEFDTFNLDINRAFVEKYGDGVKEGCELSEELDFIFKSFSEYKKREGVWAKVSMYKLKTAFNKFRNLPHASQGYYVALNNLAFGHIMSLFIEPTHIDMHFYYDLVQKTIIETMLADKVQQALMTRGRMVESNIKRWFTLQSQ